MKICVRKPSRRTTLWQGCVPFIVKDNFNTAGLETTAGSLALTGSVPGSDAFQVRRIRETGVYSEIVPHTMNVTS